MSNHVVLRPFTREEYHSFYQQYEPDSLMDPRPYRYQFTHVDRNFKYDLRMQDHSPVFGIFDHDQAVGILTLARIDHEKHRCEIGLTMCNDQCKNKGYGTKAMLLAIDKAIHEYDVQHIYADTMGNNLCMQHILDKLGFILIERVPRVYDMPTGKQDRLIYYYKANA